MFNQNVTYNKYSFLYKASNGTPKFNERSSWSGSLQLSVQSMPITTKVVSLNSVHDQVYSIQHYVIKFV
jgi:hypothetical protein